MSRLLFGAAVVAAFCSAPGARADTLVLINGRTYNDARIVSQSPSTVTVRHAGGFVQVNKSLLPESLRATYPVNTTAAAAMAQKDKDRREAEARQKREAAQKKADPVDQTQKSIYASAEPDAAATAKAKVAAHDRALTTATQHFRTKWTPGQDTVRVDSLTLKIDSLEQPAGPGGQWGFIGTGSVNYQERGSAHRALVAFEGTIKPDGSTTLTPRIVSSVDFAVPASE